MPGSGALLGAGKAAGISLRSGKDCGSLRGAVQGGDAPRGRVPGSGALLGAGKGAGISLRAGKDGGRLRVAGTGGGVGRRAVMGAKHRALWRAMK